MKTAISLGIPLLILSIMLLPVTGCAESDTESPASQARKITLDDSPEILDILSQLPVGFERLDAASEGMSNEDLLLGPDFSEVELFLCEEPYQTIFAYYCIIESRIERAGTDALIKDEGQIRTMVIENLRAGAAEEGVILSDADVDVTYPDVGDLAVLGSGTMSSYGLNIGYDLLIFNSNKVYVFVASIYLPGDSLSLIPLAEEMERRIGTFSQ